MNDEMVNEMFKQWGKSIERLGEALDEDSNNLLIVDGTIQRFEFTFELSWKSVMKLLRYREEVDVATAKQALQKAYRLGWIDDEEVWIKMLKDRNLTSHTYKQELAEEIYSHIGIYYQLIKKLHEKLKEMDNE